MSQARMRRRVIPTISFAGLLLTQAAFGTPIAVGAQARTLTVADLGLDVGVSDPQLSPDGGSVVVVTSRPDYEENRFVRRLVLVEVASGTRTEPTANPRPMPCSTSCTPDAAASPKAEPPDSTSASTLSTVRAGSRRSVSLVPGAPPMI